LRDRLGWLAIRRQHQVVSLLGYCCWTSRETERRRQLSGGKGKAKKGEGDDAAGVARRWKKGREGGFFSFYIRERAAMSLPFYPSVHHLPIYPVVSVC
jgi:hypothetical protein